MTIRTCPICKSKYNAYPAISRRDNKTEICPQCGMAEAFYDFFSYKGPEETNEEQQREDEAFWELQAEMDEEE